MLFKFFNDEVLAKVTWNGNEYEAYRIDKWNDSEVIEKIDCGKYFKKKVTCSDLSLPEEDIKEVYMVPLYGDRRTGMFIDVTNDLDKEQTLEDYFKGNFFKYKNELFFVTDDEKFEEPLMNESDIFRIYINRFPNYMIFIPREDNKES